jgi:RNA polymerase sigma-70 factor (ECF subfamily)
MPDLSALLSRVALGDRVAFRALYDATHADLFAAVRRITRNDSVAADVLQECFMTVWLRASTYDGRKAAVMTWMTTIVRNRAFDRLSLASARHETALPDGDIDGLWEAHDHAGDASACTAAWSTWSRSSARQSPSRSCTGSATARWPSSWAGRSAR